MPAGASTEQLMAGVQQVLDIFAAKGFSLKTTLLPKPASGGSGDGFTVVQQGPANLWSLQVKVLLTPCTVGQRVNMVACLNGACWVAGTSQ
jgi:hypothetical protein